MLFRVTSRREEKRKMATFTELFDFPPSFGIEAIPCPDKKLCVVSIIGKGKLNDFNSKASILNPVLDRDVFLGKESYLHEKIQQGDIECFLDTEQNVLYLHHISLYDTAVLVEKCQQLSRDGERRSFASLCQQEDFQHAKVFLFLFSVSHIILLCHPGSTFDLHYMSLFHIMDHMRLRLQASMTDVLRELSVSKEWYTACRPCSPRVLFIFQTPTFDSGPDDNFDPTMMSKSRSQKMPPIKKLQHNREDEIYRILRKSRLITNISNNSLFAVPANQEFVYIHSRRSEASDPVKYFMHQLRSNCFTGKESENVRPRGYQMSRRGNQQGPVTVEPRSAPVAPRGSEHSLKEFLWKHVHLAFTKGFDDNVGRHPIPSVFEMPTVELWFNVAIRLHEFFFSPDAKTQSVFTSFQGLLETDVRFSESRCRNVVPMAESMYRQDLPQHYVTAYHLKRLGQARQVYAHHARGPAFNKYLVELENACHDYWVSGHQQCEQRSLTNKLCINPLHRVLEDPETEENCSLPTLPHSSGLKTKAACNCGRKQADKDDPFDHKSANFDFYEALAVLCCSQLSRLALPVFQPGASVDLSPGALAAILPSHTSPPSTATSSSLLSAPHVTPSTGESHGLSPESRDEKNRGESVAGNSLSLALSLGQSGCSDLYSHGSLNTDHHDHTDHNDQDQDHQDQHDHQSEEHLNVAQEDPAVVVAVPQRQHSRTEYLPCMLHLESPPALLPQFPSWALSCLGKAACYCPQQGLDQPGFLPGSNFLLPWDILARADSKERWPAVGETGLAKKTRQRRLGKDDPGSKAYVGLEYECPRGHRFFCSAPDKIFKVSNPAILKDTAAKLLGTDMPLYTQCHCRSPKGFMAQLMRAFVVTPEAGQVRILLKARVQPGPPPTPVFHPGPETPVTLPAGGVWVLRLPHVYVGESGPYTIPSDPISLAACRLMKGIFTYQETSPDG